MRELSIKALRGMDGQEVMVHDLAYDELDQRCTVHVHSVLVPNPKNKKKLIERVFEVVLENDEFTFVYSFDTGFVNGPFSVYTLN